MTGKSEALRKSIGGNMAESMGMGVRLHDTARTPEARAVADKSAGRKRMREAGYMLLENIVPDPDQVRKEFTESSIKQLSNSLKKFGVLQPIQVRWNEKLEKYVIVSGERRYRAAKLAKLESIPCIFGEGEISESELKQRQLTENCLREDLTPMEQASAFDELIKLNDWNGQQLAEALCLSSGLVSQRLALLDLPFDIKDKVEQGQISGDAAYQVSTLKDEKTQREVADKVVSEKLSRNATKDLVKERKGKAPAKKPARPITEKKFTTDKATVSVKFRKKTVSTADILAALDEVREQLEAKRKAA